MAVKLNAKETAKLRGATDARKAGTPGYVMGTKKNFKTLAEAGLVEFNENIKDGENVAVRASDAGVSHINAAPAATPVDPNAPKPEFVIESGLAMLAVTRRVGASGSKYPFEKLEIGQSFHVAPTADMDNPAKSLASSVTAANTRFATKGEGTYKTRKGNEKPNMVLTRKFAVRAVDASDPKGVGARVWRVPLDTKA